MMENAFAKRANHAPHQKGISSRRKTVLSLEIMVAAYAIVARCKKARRGVKRFQLCQSIQYVSKIYTKHTMICKYICL